MEGLNTSPRFKIIIKTAGKLAKGDPVVRTTVSLALDLALRCLPISLSNSLPWVLIPRLLSLLSRLPKSMEYDTPRVLTPHSSHQSQAQPRVCHQWQCGRCYRLPCHFLHPDIPSRRRTHADDPHSFSTLPPPLLSPAEGEEGEWIPHPREALRSSCNYGDRCRFLHSWCVGDSFTFVTALEGHQKVVLSFSWLFDFFSAFSSSIIGDVSGIVLPSSSNRLYSASKDESVRIWDCQSGQCAAVVNLGVEIGCMITKGPWIFVGLVNAVKAWNMETNNEISLSGPVGQVYSLEANDELFFAGSQPAAILLGHNLTVVSLIVGGAQRLYSGSMDSTIRVWDLGTFQCLQTLTDHTSVVWAATESGNIEVTYTHNAEHGVLGLCGMHDAQAKPVLMCACDDNAVRVYDLPSFKERGKVVHPADLCFKLPENVSLEEGAMCEPLRVGLHACRRALVGPETNILIMGAGPIGMVTMLAARGFGAPRIIIVDISDHRLTVAKKLGADDIVKVSAVIQV
ncbi:hypothetical protein ACLOJK_005167 [Asimina triloba]